MAEWVRLHAQFEALREEFLKRADELRTQFILTAEIQATLRRRHRVDGFDERTNHQTVAPFRETEPSTPNRRSTDKPH